MPTQVFHSFRYTHMCCTHISSLIIRLNCHFIFTSSITLTSIWVTDNTFWSVPKSIKLDTQAYQHVANYISAIKYTTITMKRLIKNSLAVAVCSRVCCFTLDDQYKGCECHVWNFCSSAHFSDQTSAFQHIYTGLKLHSGINTKGCPVRGDLKVCCIYGLYYWGNAATV